MYVKALRKIFLLAVKVEIRHFIHASLWHIIFSLPTGVKNAIKHPEKQGS